ncbi:hypothetical protein [Trichormus sp. NMC-1]|nr:hypothetical protein [Trichormus sp. NMC-1]
MANATLGKCTRSSAANGLILCPIFSFSVTLEIDLSLGNRALTL